MKHQRFSLNDLGRALSILQNSERLLVMCRDGTVLFVVHETSWVYFIFGADSTSSVSAGSSFDEAAEQARRRANDFGGIAWEKRLP